MKNKKYFYKEILQNNIDIPQIGIYKITNIINNKCYIGQSTNILIRWITHIQNTIENKSQIYLYQEIRKQKIENFSFEVIEKCTIEQLNGKEKYWFYYYNCLKPNGYNSQIPTDYKRTNKKIVKPKKIITNFEYIPYQLVLKSTI